MCFWLRKGEKYYRLWRSISLERRRLISLWLTTHHTTMKKKIAHSNWNIRHPIVITVSHEYWITTQFKILYRAASILLRRALSFSFAMSTTVGGPRLLLLLILFLLCAKRSSLWRSLWRLMPSCRDSAGLGEGFLLRLLWS